MVHSHHRFSPAWGFSIRGGGRHVDLFERICFLLTVLDAESHDAKVAVSIRPKAAFEAALNTTGSYSIA
jgi:hypothetical protein